MRRTWSSPGPFRVGNRVKISSWSPPIVGEVIEDRGLIGEGRRHYYTVRLLIDEPDDLLILESPAEESELVPERGVGALPEK